MRLPITITIGLAWAGLVACAPGREHAITGARVSLSAADDSFELTSRVRTHGRRCLTVVMLIPNGDLDLTRAYAEALRNAPPGTTGLADVTFEDEETRVNGVYYQRCIVVRGLPAKLKAAVPTTPAEPLAPATTSRTDPAPTTKEPDPPRKTEPTRAVDEPVAPKTPPGQTPTTEPAGVVRLEGRRWQRCSAGQELAGKSCNGRALAVTHEAAIRACANLSHDGVAWRLPTRAELQSLLGPKEGETAARTRADLFPATPADIFWTADEYKTAAVYVIDFGNGSAYPYGKTGRAHVRCVSD